MLTLYQLCLGYIGNNIASLDSLVGFPDSIGQEIFLEAASQNKFKNLRFQTQSHSDSCRSRSKDKNPLKIFFEAYADCGILESLDLKESHLFVDDALEENLWLFQGLIQLDLSSCGLGDQHTILPMLTKLPKMKILSLSQNGLTNEGVRNLTANLRIFPEKFTFLSNLNLSGNPGITTRSLLFLRSLSALAVLNVSDTAICSTWQKQSDNISPFNEHSLCDCVKSAFHIKTQGWATAIVTAWKSEYSTQQEQVELTASSKPCSGTFTHSVQSFYSKKRRQQISAVPFEEENLLIKDTPLVLVTSRFHCPHMRKQTWNSSAVKPADSVEMPLKHKTSMNTLDGKMVLEAKVHSLQNNNYSYHDREKHDPRHNISFESHPLAKRRCEQDKGQDMSRELISKGDDISVRQDGDDSLLSLYAFPQRRQRSRRGSILQLLKKMS